MADEQYTFTKARDRLDDIVVQVRKKDVSLEHSLDLLEEGVKLAAACTELIDHTEWRTVADELRAEEDESDLSAEARDAAEPVADATEATVVDERTDPSAADQVDGVDAESGPAESQEPLGEAP